MLCCVLCPEGGHNDMSVENILQQIDREISSLTQARALLAGISNGSSGLKIVTRSTTGKRIISAAARRRMAAAQKARWAKYKAAKKAG
jgi:hypothetical protein